MRTLVSISLALAGLTALAALAAPVGAANGESPKELGTVDWERRYDAGVARARADGRPLFLLFQEVPGCQTCVGFGETVLSNRLLVDAIETEFVPVAILNNAGGHDREVLRRFGEPAWNNPVVRFVDAQGRDLIPREDGVWTAHAIASRMVAALGAANRPVPAYLRLAAEEARAPFADTAVFQTHCFWEGEVCLGDQPGVVATEAAWLDGSEVVEVRFDPRATSYEQLLQRARSKGCASAVFATTEERARIAGRVYGDAALHSNDPPRRAPDSDQKRHLRASPLHALDLTPLQQARVNAALAIGDDPLQWLSPRQRAAVR